MNTGFRYQSNISTSQLYNVLEEPSNNSSLHSMSYVVKLFNANTVIQVHISLVSVH